MLIQLSTQCQMECTHCIVDSLPSGEHMSMETWADVKRFIRGVTKVVNRNGKPFSLPMLQFSGGEPTENPYFATIIEDILKEHYHAGLITNGMWVDDDEKFRTIKALSKSFPDFSIQVTNDKRYYPKRVNFKKLKEINKVHIEKQIRLCDPLGRAKVNNLPEGSYVRKAPSCFDFRVNIEAFGSLFEMIYFFMERGKFCFPVIGVDGHVRTSDLNECESLGHVSLGPDKIFQAMKDSMCDACGFSNRLSGMTRNIWDERVMKK